MKYFITILCMSFFQLSNASIRQNRLDLLKEELQKFKRDHFEKLEITNKSLEDIEFLDIYTQSMKKAYIESKEADKSLYLQVQDIKSIEEMIGNQNEVDFGIKYTLKTIEKISTLYNQLVKLQTIMTVIEHSNYLTKVKDATFQEVFKEKLKFLSELIATISLQLKFLEKHLSPFRAIEVVKRIFTSQYDDLYLDVATFIKTLELHIKSQQKL